MVANIGRVGSADGFGNRPQQHRVDGTETVPNGLTAEAKKALAAPSPIDLKQKVFEMLTGAKEILDQHKIKSEIIEGPNDLHQLACDALGSDVYATLPMTILKGGKISTEPTIEPLYKPKKGEFPVFDSLPDEIKQSLSLGAYIIPDASKYNNGWNGKTDGVLTIDGSESYSDGGKTIVSFKHEKPGDVNTWAQTFFDEMAMAQTDSNSNDRLPF